MTGRAEAKSPANHIERDVGGSSDDAARAAPWNGKAIVAPVARDHRFQHYVPDRFSLMRTVSTSAERFELRLQSLLHRETSQQLAIIPGREILTVGRELRIEVIELAVIDLAWTQLVGLRDELTRAIAAAVPLTTDEASERLAQLTGQIAVAEGELSRLASETRAEAATPFSRELGRLNDTIGTLVDRLEGVARPQSPLPPGANSTQHTRRRRIMAAGVGVALLAALVGLRLLPPSEGLRAWLQLQPTGLERPGAVLQSGGGGLTNDPQASRAPPSLALSRGAATPSQEAAPVPILVPERSLVEPPADAALSSVSGEQPLAHPTTVPIQAAAPSTSAALTTANVETERRLQLPAVPLVTATPLPIAPTPPAPQTAVEATMPDATAPDTSDKRALPVEAGPHLAIHVDAETWIRVRDGAGRSYLSRVLKAGETWPVPAIPGLLLTTGNSASTFILTDGVSGSALGPERVVRTEKLP